MGAKRSAGAVAVPAWKKMRGQTVKAKIAAVVSALEDTTLPAEAPESARRMLAAGAAAALSSAIENRHEMAEATVAMIKEALSDIGSRLAQRSAEAQRSADGAVADLELQRAQLQVAEDDVQEAQRYVETKSGSLRGVEAKAAEAAQELLAAETEQKARMKERKTLLSEQNHYRSLEGEDLKALLEAGHGAGGSEKQAKKICDRLLKALGKLGADNALLVAAPKALLKSVEERQGFDHHVVSAAKAMLDGRLALLQEQLEASEQAEAGTAAELTVKVQAVEEAKAAQEEIAQSVQMAQSEKQQKEAAAAAARSSLEETKQKLEELRGAAAAAAAEVETFLEVTETFLFLATRSTAPAPVESEVQADETKKEVEGTVSQPEATGVMTEG